MSFMYSNDDIRHLQKRDFKMTDADVETIMEACLKDTGLTFEVVDEVVIVKPAVQVMNSVPQKKMVLSGTVKDNRGDVMPGVTVRIKGTTLGVATDIDGKWNLEIPEMNDVVLVFSFVGMESQEIEPGNRTVIDVVMEVAKENLEEVVVTGIFKRNKEGFTGSATQVSGDEIKKMTAGNVLKALEMLDPGFRMNTSNLAGSNPNAIPDFQMRGQASLGNYEANDVVVLRGDVNTRPNQPLFVLDGVIGVDATTIMDLDPAQVESITLLKDAAATVIYGSEAANGVVVVETKAPVPGKLRFTYNGNYGLEWPDLSVYDLMNAGEKLRVEELAGYYANKDDVGLQNYYNHLKQEVLRGVDTYWLGEPVQTAFSHRHGLTVEGGDRALRYKIYLGAKWDPGVMKETNLNTKTGKIDLNYRQNKILINNSLTVDYSDGTRESPYGTFQDYAIVNPYYRKTDENGNIKQVLDTGETNTDYNSSGYVGDYYKAILNPLWNKQFGSKNSSRKFELREALKLEYLPIDALRLSLDFSLSRNDGTVEVFKSAQHNDFYEEKDPSLKGSYDWTKNENTSYRLRLSGAYNKSWGDHLLAGFASYSINESQLKTTALSMKGFPNDRLSEVYMGTEFQNTTGNENMTRALAFVMTLNYSYKQRYAVDYSMSINASSEFGKNNRYAPFWSVGAGWNLHNEAFLQKEWLNTLRFRYSYGVTGNISFPSYQAITTYTYNQDNYYLHGMGAVPKQMGNKDLTWQSTKTHNIGLNADFWDSRFSITFDYYIKTTDDLLIDQTIPPSIGETAVKSNLGKQRNKGYEFDIAAVLVQNKDWRFSLKLNGAHNKNKILAISNALAAANDKANASSEGKPKVLYKEGQSTTAIYAVRSAGINPATGKEVFINKNGEYTLTYNTADKVVIGDEAPKLEGSIFPMLSFRNWSLNISMSYKFGGQVYNLTRAANVENVDPKKNVDQRAFDERWKNVNDLFPYLDIADTESRTSYQSSRFVEDDDILEINRIEIAYEFRSNWLKQIGFKRLRLAAGMNDVARLSTVKYERGTSYPFSRGFSFTISPTF